MGLILDALPIPAPIEAELFAERAHGFVGRRFIEVTAALKHADVEGDAEVVVAVTAASVGHDVAGPRAALLVERVLLLVSARAGDDLDGDPGGGSGDDQGAGQRLHGRQERRDVLLTARVGDCGHFGCLRQLADDLPADGGPGFQAGIAIHRDADFGLHRANGGIEVHFA